MDSSCKNRSKRRNLVIDCIGNRVDISQYGEQLEKDADVDAYNGFQFQLIMYHDGTIQQRFDTVLTDRFEASIAGQLSYPNLVRKRVEADRKWTRVGATNRDWQIPNG